MVPALQVGATEQCPVLCRQREDPGGHRLHRQAGRQTGRKPTTRPSATWANCLSKYRSLKVFMDACVHCGACTDKCHYFIGTNDPKNMPVARQDLMRSVYRRYFTPAGKMFPSLVGARDLTKEVLDEWFTYYWQCSECRRCSVFCPYGIDTAEITMAASRDSRHGRLRPEVLERDSSARCTRSATTSACPDRRLRIRWLVLKRTSRTTPASTSSYPLDVRGAEVLLVTPSADFFAEPHIESLIGYGKVFHAAGISWTLFDEGLGSRQLRHVHRQLRPVAQDRPACARGRAGTWASSASWSASAAMPGASPTPSGIP